MITNKLTIEYNDDNSIRYIAGEFTSTYRHHAMLIKIDKIGVFTNNSDYCTCATHGKTGNCTHVYRLKEIYDNMAKSFLEFAGISHTI